MRNTIVFVDRKTMPATRASLNDMLVANENSSFLGGDASLSVTASVRGYPGEFAGFRECSRDSVNVRDICMCSRGPASVRGSPRSFPGFRSRASVSVRVRLGSFLSVR